MDEHELGGAISITKARNEFDIDQYVVYWGKDEKSKLEPSDGQPALIGSAVPTFSDTEVHVKQNTKVGFNIYSTGSNRYPTGGNMVPPSDREYIIPSKQKIIGYLLSRRPPKSRLGMTSALL